MRPRHLAASAAGAGAAGFGWGLIEANLAFTLRRATVPVLPTGAMSIRVLHLSDLHLVDYQKPKVRWLAALQNLRPDLVVNTGDNLASHHAVPALLQAWGDLLRIPGVFVFGSNDYLAPKTVNPLRYFAGPSKAGEKPREELPWRELRDAMTGHGWHDLNHHRARLQINGTAIEFRGTDDAHLKRDDYSLVAGAPAAGTDLSIGVTHAPYLRVLDAMAADGLDLILAGHTHGGQVCVPFHGALVTNCDLDTDRVKGLSRHTVDDHTSWLHVSAGAGTSPYAPYRFACRPEATLLELVPRNSP